MTDSHSLFCSFRYDADGKRFCGRCGRPTAYRGPDEPRRVCGTVLAVRIEPCVHLGKYPVGRVACESCRPGTFLKTFACSSPDVAQDQAIRAEQTLPDSVANCLDCGYYEAPTAGG